MYPELKHCNYIKLSCMVIKKTVYKVKTINVQTLGSQSCLCPAGRFFVTTNLVLALIYA